MNENPYSPPESNLDPEKGGKPDRRDVTPEMKARYNRNSLAIGIPGLLTQIAGNIMQREDENNLLGAGLVLVGTAVLMLGLSYYARMKGRHPAWCLLGFFSLIGLIVLALLGDRTNEVEAAETETETPATDLPDSDR